MQLARESIRIPSGHSFRVLRWDRSLEEVSCVVAPGQLEPIAGEGTRWHFHVEMELTLFLTGSGTRFVGDHIGTFGAGDLVLLGEGLPHYWHAPDRSSGLAVQWLFPESHPFWSFPENLRLANLFRLARRGVHFSGRVAAEIRELMNQLALAQAVEQLATLFAIFARLSCIHRSEQRLLSTQSFSLSPELDHEEAIARAVRLLIAQFRNEIRLAELLAVTGMSRPTFARQFKHHSGHTFSEFVNQLRLQAACRELQESSRSVLEIALSCGFTQISFFNRLFRRVMNCSPSEYRSRMRKKRPVS